VKLWLEDTNTSSAQLWVDRGDGSWQSSSPPCCGAAGPHKPLAAATAAGWEIFSTQAVLARSGTARFALQIDTACPAAGAMVRKVVLSKIGAGWNRVEGTVRRRCLPVNDSEREIFFEYERAEIYVHGVFSSACRRVRDPRPVRHTVCLFMYLFI
jgi:hypothetical protein